MNDASGLPLILARSRWYSQRLFIMPVLQKATSRRDLLHPLLDGLHREPHVNIRAHHKAPPVTNAFTFDLIFFTAYMLPHTPGKLPALFGLLNRPA